MADERRDALRATFTEVRGHWNDTWEAVLQADPDFLEAYLDLSAHPWRHGVLEPKVKEFVLIAVDGSATHLFGPGVKAHIALALEFGATPAEVMEVIEVVSTLGRHTLELGVPILLQELGEPGDGDDPMAALAQLDPAFHEVWTRFAAVGAEGGELEPKVRELVLAAVAAAPTHLHAEGLRRHIRAAIALGATKEELIEVLQLASIIGIHTASVAVPVLSEAAA